MASKAKQTRKSKDEMERRLQRLLVGKDLPHSDKLLVPLSPEVQTKKLNDRKEVLEKKIEEIEETMACQHVGGPSLSDDRDDRFIEWQKRVAEDVRGAGALFDDDFGQRGQAGG